MTNFLLFKKNTQKTTNKFNFESLYKFALFDTTQKWKVKCLYLVSIYLRYRQLASWIPVKTLRWKLITHDFQTSLLKKNIKIWLSTPIKRQIIISLRNLCTMKTRDSRILRVRAFDFGWKMKLKNIKIMNW